MKKSFLGYPNSVTLQIHLKSRSERFKKFIFWNLKLAKQITNDEILRFYLRLWGLKFSNVRIKTKVSKCLSINLQKSTELMWKHYLRFTWIENDSQTRKYTGLISKQLLSKVLDMTSTTTSWGSWLLKYEFHAMIVD